MESEVYWDIVYFQLFDISSLLRLASYFQELYILLIHQKQTW